MQTALRLTAEVQPGGKIEVMDAQLPVGTPVEVIVLLPQVPAAPRRSILAVLADAPGHLAFQSAADRAAGRYGLRCVAAPSRLGTR